MPGRGTERRERPYINMGVVRLSFLSGIRSLKVASSLMPANDHVIIPGLND